MKITLLKHKAKYPKDEWINLKDFKKYQKNRNRVMRGTNEAYMFMDTYTEQKVSPMQTP